MDPQIFRKRKLAELTNEIGVYALCDLDGIPIYVGCSFDGIRARVQRHLSSARSDIIANRQIDVWEIAYVWAWPVNHKDEITPLEHHLYALFQTQNSLMNGTVLSSNEEKKVSVPEKQVLQVIDEKERVERLDPMVRLPRQISHYLSLVDYILTVKNKPHLRRSLEAHFQRLVLYHRNFLS